MNAFAPAATNVGNPTLNVAIFGIFVVITLAIVIHAISSLKMQSGFPDGSGE